MQVVTNKGRMYMRIHTVEPPIVEPPRKGHCIKNLSTVNSSRDPKILFPYYYIVAIQFEPPKRGQPLYKGPCEFIMCPLLGGFTVYALQCKPVRVSRVFPPPVSTTTPLLLLFATHCVLMCIMILYDFTWHVFVCVCVCVCVCVGCTPWLLCNVLPIMEITVYASIILSYARFNK